MGDIGRHYPDTDPRWKGADSRVFLEHAVVLLAEQGYRPSSVDAVVILERPKLAPHIASICAALAAVPAPSRLLRQRESHAVAVIERVS